MIWVGNVQIGGKKTTTPIQKNTPLLQWVWEFLRRNQEYQSDHQRYISKEARKDNEALHETLNGRAYNDHLQSRGFKSSKFRGFIEKKNLPMTMDSLVIEPPALEGESLMNWVERTGGDWIRWINPAIFLGQKWFGDEYNSYIPDPSLSNAWKHPQFSFALTPCQTYFPAQYKASRKEVGNAAIQGKKTNTSKPKKKAEEGGNEPFEAIISKIRGGNTPYKEITFTPKELNEVLLKFDLALPIRGQLNTCKRFLEEAQKEYKAIGGEIYQLRNYIKHFRNYLRVLDASYENVDVSRIAEELFPKMKNVYDHEYPGNRNVKQDLKSAIDYQNWKYRYIVLSIPPKKSSLS